MNNARRLYSNEFRTNRPTNGFTKGFAVDLHSNINLNDPLVNAHQWVTVPNPHRQRALLHACDNCGVVRSENTQMKNCGAEQGQGIITKALMVIKH